jgi:hypothetical protein
LERTDKAKQRLRVASIVIIKKYFGFASGNKQNRESVNKLALKNYFLHSFSSEERKKSGINKKKSRSDELSRGVRQLGRRQANSRYFRSSSDLGQEFQWTAKQGLSGGPLGGTCNCTHSS